MIRRFILSLCCLIWSVFASASGIGFYASNNLFITPYTAAGGQLRAQFLYNLNPNASGAFDSSVSGWLSVDVAQNYNLSDDTHEIRIDYSTVINYELITSQFWPDQITSQPVSETIWYITTDALLNGQAEFHRTEYPDMVDTGDLIFSQQSFDAPGTPFTCIECGLDIYLNLLFMDFTGGTLSVDFSDTDLSILDGQDFFDGNNPYGFDLHLVAKPVPIPAAFWLLGSSLMLLWIRLPR